jgi:hypothetical protein
MWLLLSALLVFAGSGNRVDETDFERLKGFYPHQDYLRKLEAERNKGVEDEKARKKRLDEEREAGITEYKKKKALEDARVKSGSKEFSEYLMQLEVYEIKKRRDQEEYQKKQIVLQKQFLFEAPVTLETEMGFPTSGVRADWAKRKSFIDGGKGSKSSGGGGSGGYVPPSIPSFDSPPPVPSMVEVPPPPDIPEFDSDLPPPPPPGELFEDAIPPPPFDEEPDF